MYKLSAFLFSIFASLAAATAQDNIFSQYYAMPLTVNPGFAGSAFAPRIGLAYRNEWPGFNNAYRTYAISYEQQMDRVKSGIGFILEGDDAGAGIYKSTHFGAIYAYRLQVSEGLFLKLGVEAGARQTSLDWDKLVFPDDIDPLGGITPGSNLETRPEQLTQTKLDISSGLLLYSEKLYLGAALQHLNTPNEGFLLVNDNVSRGLPLRYTFHGGTEITLSKGNKQKPASFLSPNFLFVSQGPYRQINLGAYAGIGSVFTGLWYRHTLRNSDSAILLMGFREGIFKVGLSYDITVSGLAGRSGGTYEITLGVLLDKDEVLKKKHKAAQLQDCFNMFR